LANRTILQFCRQTLAGGFVPQIRIVTVCAKLRICHNVGMSASSESRHAANLRAEALRRIINQIGPIRSLRQIADELTRRQIPTPRGGAWHPQTVSVLLGRLGIVPGIEISDGPLMLARKLGRASIDLVCTSPPYGMQRVRQYGGILESRYPQWTVDWMAQIRPLLTTRGSIALVIRPHVREGQLSDYVLRTRLALRDAGWIECDEIIWIKPGSPPLGHKFRPRRSWESVLWFSRSRRPYCDPKANGTPSKKIGMIVRKGNNSHYLNGDSGGYEAGIARCRDYVEISTAWADTHSDNTHPAQYPEPLARWIIRLLCPPGGTVADPFLGSGTTAVAARNAGMRFVGSDVNPEYVQIARRRMLR
jgi:DNA modification methylase